MPKWISAVNRKDWVPTEYNRLCSEHFIRGKQRLFFYQELKVSFHPPTESDRILEDERRTETELKVSFHPPIESDKITEDEKRTTTELKVSFHPPIEFDKITEDEQRTTTTGIVREMSDKGILGTKVSFHPHTIWEEVEKDQVSLLESKSSSETIESTPRETKVQRSFLSPRLILGIMGFGCFFVFAVLRLNISIAIVAMVDWSSFKNKKTHNQTCHYGREADKKSLEGGEFPWDQKMQAFILSSYYIGLTATQFLGGRLAEKVSAKAVLFYGTSIATLATLFSPEAARLNVYLLIALQILKGAGQGIVVPAFSVMVGNWVSVPERTSFMAWTTSGMPIGAFISTLVSGYLCKISFMDGWPTVFYVCSIVGVVWCAFWFILIYDSPKEHPWIPHSELHRYTSLRTQQIAHLRPAIPLKAMATSLPAWSYVFVGFASFWTISLYSLVLPTFMGTILRFPIEINGIMSSLPNLAQAFLMLLSSNLCDYLQGKHYAKVTTIRKVTLTIGLVGFSACMIGVNFAGCNRTLNVILLTAALGFTGINFPAIMVLPVDLTPKFAGTLSGFQSTFGSLSGLVIPLIIGFLTEGNQSRKEWIFMFYLSGGICLFSVIFFLIFGESEVQSWNYQLTNTERTRDLVTSK